MFNLHNFEEVLAMAALILLAVAASLIYSPSITAVYPLDSVDFETFFEQQEPAAECFTDSDCQLQCPPPADDEECDGGPQPAMPAAHPIGFIYG